MFVILSYIALVLFIFYEIVSSFILFFVPRWLLRRRKDIRGQRVLITGAGSGVGRQLAVEFSKYETCLVLVDIDRQSLLETEKLLDRRSPVFIYDCDVSDYGKVCEMAEKVKEEAGDVDILVNNAGVVAGKYLKDLTEKDVQNTMGVNVLAHFWTCKAFLPAMVERDRGHLVSVVSVAGKAPGPRASEYVASKFAAMGFVTTLEFELREQGVEGVKVTVVCPSFIDSGLFQGFKMSIGSVLTPEAVAKEIVRAVLEEREIVYIHHYFRHLVLVHEFCPRWLLIKLAKLTGDIHCMKNFTGRGGKSPHLTNKDDKME